MKLIKSIEIAYFRSIYKIKLDQLEDQTIIFGRNDSGKSNILRSLNLFFNECTNPEQVFNFNNDFNHARLSESNSAADTRKFVYIKLEFNTPKNWRNSLGDNFWIKKRWSVSRGANVIIDSSLSGNKQQFITKFLNKVRFHYIPAIKDRSIFENLLAEVYKVISTSKEFTSSLSSFTTELQERTGEISKNILSSIGLTSVISPPVDLTELFRSLDFETTNNYGDNYSLTLQKGDGIQVRHIPSILGFISDNSNEDFHIWGFEEPENSLELANAVKESESLLNFSKSKNKQLFITSHSPAFFSINDEQSKRYFVNKKVREGLIKETSEITVVNDNEIPSELMGETPLLPLISSYLKIANEKITKLNSDLESINKLIEEIKSPIIFLEGESDKIIFDKAWELFGNESIKIKSVSSSGTTKMKSLAQDGKILSTISERENVFVLIDNDREGRELSKFGDKRLKVNGGGNWVQHNSNKSYWCRLKFSEDFKKHMKHLKIPENSWPYTIENCFNRDVHKKAIKESVLLFDEFPHDELLNCDISKKIVIPLCCDNEQTYIRAPNKDYKISFAKWIVEQPSVNSDLFFLKDLIESMVGIIEK